MKKIIAAVLLSFILFTGVGYAPITKAQESTPSQQEITNQLIQLLLQMIAQLQQQINDILAQQTATNSTIQQQSETISQQNQDLDAVQKKQDCNELQKKTPQTGNYEFINRDIVGYYENAKSRLDKEISELNRLSNIVNPTSQERDNKIEAENEVKFWTKNVDEAKPLYDNFIKECK